MAISPSSMRIRNLSTQLAPLFSVDDAKGQKIG
jgi:hypothetical protein